MNNFRGGQAGLSKLLLRKAAEKLARTSLYKNAQSIAVSFGVGAALTVLRKFGNGDWWAAYISHAVINLTEEERVSISSLRRMRLGLPLGIVCATATTEM